MDGILGCDDASRNAPNKKTAKDAAVAKSGRTGAELGARGALGGSRPQIALDDPAVGAERCHVARLIEEPDAFPFVEE